MNFCSQCGGAIAQRIPSGDDRERHVCTACEHVHYRNPLVVVGCLVERDDEILLCRRAIEPAHGRWTPPAGYLEIGESMTDGAKRETMEEAGAAVDITAPHSFLDLTHIGQVYAMFRATLLRPSVAPGEESLECRFFRFDELPWSELAFPAVHFGLQLLLEDREDGACRVHHGQLRWTGRGSRFDAANYEIQGHLRSALG